MVAPTPFFSDRGCHVRILEEARELTRRGANVSICAYGGGFDVPGLNIRRSWSVNAYGSDSIGPSFHKFHYDIGLLFVTLSEALRLKPDIIHGHLHEGCLIGKAASILTGAPLVFDYQGSIFGEAEAHGFLHRRPWLAGVFKLAEKVIDNLADVVIMSSRHFLPGTHLAPSRAEIVQDGVDLDVFSARSKPDDGDVKVAFLGLLTEYQGVDVLLMAVRELIRTCPEVHFMVMGFPNLEHYKKLALRMGISEHVTFTGRVPYGEAAGMLSRAHIAVAPKIAATESNGKVLNYMALGIPTVAFDLPVNRELMGDAGILVDPADRSIRAAEGLARAIKELIEDPGRREELSKAGRERVESRFSTQKMGDDLIKSYEKALNYRQARKSWWRPGKRTYSSLSGAD